jgi:electron transfer flavoprotein alpha subunit
MSADIYLVVEHVMGHLAEISYVMAAAATELAEATGGKTYGLLLKHGDPNPAEALRVDELLVVDHPDLNEFTPDAYTNALHAVLGERDARLVFFGDTTIGAGVAGLLSMRMEWPLASACKELKATNSSIQFVSQICGGKALAEGELPEPTCLVTMVPGGYRPENGMSETAPSMTSLELPNLEPIRIRFVEYIEPEAGEVDIAKESILVAAGRGIQREDNLELVNALADALGGAVCASRPIVDQDWLPTSRLVGKSGKSVKPKVYLALGVSGAPEHVEGMAESELIIAVNTDEKAPIFEVAQYGAEVDLLDLLPELTERIEAAKGG